MLYLIKQIQKYLSRQFELPEKKVILQGYQEFFSKYFFTYDKYRQFLERVNLPYLIYNLPEFTMKRSALNQTWNTTGFNQGVELDKYNVYIQKTFISVPINITLYTESRQQLLQYISKFLSTFDIPTSNLLITFPIETPPDETSTRKLINEEIFTIISPESISDQSEYVFDENMRTFKLTTSFTLEGYILTKIMFERKIDKITINVILPPGQLLQQLQESILWNDFTQQQKISTDTPTTEINLMNVELLKQTDLSSPELETNSIIASFKSNVFSLPMDNILIRTTPNELQRIPINITSNNLVSIENVTNNILNSDIQQQLYSKISNTLQTMTENNVITFSDNLNIVLQSYNYDQNIYTQIYSQVSEQISTNILNKLKLIVEQIQTNTLLDKIIETYIDVVFLDNAQFDKRLRFSLNVDNVYDTISTLVQSTIDIFEQQILSITSELGQYNSGTSLSELSNTTQEIFNMIQQTLIDNTLITITSPETNEVIVTTSLLNPDNEYLPQITFNILYSVISEIYQQLNNTNNINIEVEDINIDIEVSYRVSEEVNIYTVVY